MNRIDAILMLRMVVVGLLFAAIGCKGETNLPPRSASQSGESLRVRAQGQILPAGGFVRLSVAPGDVVDQVLVQVGDQVPAGKELIVLRSAALHEKQLAALQAQLAAAEQEQEQTISQAGYQVQIAEEKMKNVTARQNSLTRQASLLDLAQSQLRASREVLAKLESIAQDQLTREFIGELEIDRQRISVSEVELKFKQQEENYRQSQEALAYAGRAADLELEIARNALKAAQESSAISVLEAQLSTLHQQILASRVLAPQAGQIVAVNVQPGEAGMQLPLVELANVDQLVCEVEINEMDAAKVQIGDRATISSRAFSEAISGTVTRIYSLVGRPHLRPVDPLARTDFRTVIAQVALDRAEPARQWLQLQVQVEIETREASTSPR